MAANNLENTDLPPAIFLMGPTASGKTDLAMRLVDAMNAEIISVDSALIYRGMDIGTAKPTSEELAAYPHHLVNIRDPRESYSAADFRSDSLALMHDITARGKVPLLVGGTMMYFKMLLEGMSNMPEADQTIRAEIEADAAKHGWAYVHQQLAAVDAVSAERIHPNDPQRLQRALEVYRISGKTMTQLRTEEQLHRAQKVLPFNALQLAIAPTDRKVLHQRIEQRFIAMLSSGFEDEVRSLYARGDLHADMPSIRSVGYRQMWQYLQGEVSYKRMQEKGIVATRQLAKRQLTWLRSWQNLHWLYTDEAASNNSSREAQANVLLAKALNIVSE